MERDHHVELTDGGKYNFNSHAHVERDYMTMPKFTTIRHFNSHAHVERDEAQSQVTAQYKNFNSHAHVERDIFVMPPTKGEIDFNSHAHVERDKKEELKWLKQRISTHTLTWSVTKRLNIFFFCKIFQLTRSRGA